MENDFINILLEETINELTNGNVETLDESAATEQSKQIKAKMKASLKESSDYLHGRLSKEEGKQKYKEYKEISKKYQNIIKQLPLNTTKDVIIRGTLRFLGAAAAVTALTILSLKLSDKYLTHAETVYKNGIVASTEFVEIDASGNIIGKGTAQVIDDTVKNSSKYLNARANADIIKTAFVPTMSGIGYIEAVIQGLLGFNKRYSKESAKKQWEKFDKRITTAYEKYYK